MSTFIYIMLAWIVISIVCAIAFGPEIDRKLKKEGQRRQYGSVRHNIMRGDF